MKYVYHLQLHRNTQILQTILPDILAVGLLLPFFIIFKIF